MRKGLLISLVIITLFSIVSAQAEGFNPTTVSSLSAHLLREGKISATAGELYDLSVSLTVPQDTNYQNVTLTLPPEAQLTQEGENQVLKISYSKKFRSYSYSISADVDSVSRRVYFLPTSYTVDKGKLKYLRETEHIVITPEIRKQAREITHGYKEDIDKIAALAVWVNNHVTYDIKEIGKNKNSSYVMSNPRGVCVEFTNLFIALARSLGYPTRSVLGYVYSPNYGWQLHSWAEVYIGEWVGVDPTWLEVGYIDATHIPMYFSEDTSAELIERAHAKSSLDYAQMIWEGRGALGGSTDEIKVINYTQTTVPYDIQVFPQRLVRGEEGAILIVVYSDQYRLFTARPITCESETDIISFDFSEVNVLLHPGVNYVILPFKTSPLLKRDYTYYCPVIISHTFGSDKISLSVSNLPKAPKKFSVIPYQYNSRNVAVKLTSLGDLSSQNITIIKDFGKEEITLPPRSKKEVTIDLSDGLSNSFLVYDGVHAQVVRLPSDYLAHSNTIYKVSNLSLTTAIPSDGKGSLRATFEVKSNNTYTIRLYIDGSEVFSDTSSKPLYVVDYEIPSLLGSHELLLVADFGNERYVYDTTYEVFDPVIKVIKESEDGCVYTFNVEGPYDTYIVYVDGKEIVSNKVQIENGEHVLSVVWIDKAGIPREYTEKFSTVGVCGLNRTHICAVVILGAIFSFILIYIKSKRSR